MLCTCCCSVAQSCPTLCDPMEYSMPGLPVPHHLPDITQIRVNSIGDAIQPSHPLTPSSPSALSLSQHLAFFQWVVCSRQMTKTLELQLQHQFLQWIYSVDRPWNWLFWSPCCPRDFQESSYADTNSHWRPKKRMLAEDITGRFLVEQNYLPP